MSRSVWAVFLAAIFVLTRGEGEAYAATNHTLSVKLRDLPVGKKIRIGDTTSGLSFVKVGENEYMSIEPTCDDGLNIGESIDFDYNGTDGSDGSVQKFDTCSGHTYKLEVWGAEGGLATYRGAVTEEIVREYNASIPGKGGYSYGSVTIVDDNVTLYVFVGGSGISGSAAQSLKSIGGYNGGGWGGQTVDLNCTGGGGMTHISLTNNQVPSNNNSAAWNPNGTLIAAGGGGGTDDYGGTPGGGNDGSGGYGGGSSGGYSKNVGVNDAVPGTQISGYKQGIGENCSVEGDTGGGGGGWYGGRCGTVAHNSGGSGGSGWIYTQSTYNNWRQNGSGASSINWTISSDYYLVNANTYDGNMTFTAPSGNSETGHIHNGYARITRLN